MNRDRRKRDTRKHPNVRANANAIAIKHPTTLPNFVQDTIFPISSPPYHIVTSLHSSEQRVGVIGRADDGNQRRMERRRKDAEKRCGHGDAYIVQGARARKRNQNQGSKHKRRKEMAEAAMGQYQWCQGFLYFPLSFLIYFAFFPFIFV